MAVYCLLATAINCCLVSPATALDINKLNIESNKAFENYISQNLDVGLRINHDSNRFDGFYQPDEDRLDGYQYDSQDRRARLSLKLPIRR